MALKSHSMAYSYELNNKLIIIRCGIWAGAGATQRKKVILAFPKGTAGNKRITDVVGLC